MTDPYTALRQALTDVAEELRETVERIEASPYLTKGHYGEYMALLSAVDDPDDPMKRKMTACALMMAGANRDGVATALRLTAGG